MSDQPIVLKSFIYRHEAEQVQEVLSAAGIHSVIKGDDAAGWAPHIGIAEGGVSLLVSESNLEDAIALLKPADQKED